MHRGLATMRAVHSWGMGQYGRLPEWARVVVRVTALVATLHVLSRLFLKVTHLPGQSFEEPVLLIELVRHLFSHSIASFLFVGFIGALGVVAVWTRSLGPRWEALPFGRRFRVLALLVSGVLAWSFGTYNYNAHFDQSHLFDRLLVIALVGLVAWRPAFIWAFVLSLLPLYWQFASPIGGASMIEPLLLVRVLLLLGVAYLGRSLAARVRGTDVVFLIVILIASAYWASGIGKLGLENWLADDRPYYLLYASHANGWLSHLSTGRIDQFANLLAAANMPVKLFTLAVEAGAILAVTGRGALRAFLIGCLLLHTGIFMSSGFFFWRWILLDGAVLILFAGPRRVELPIFTPAYIVLSILLIASGPVWSRPGKLAWRDAPLSYAYRFEAETADGVRYNLPPRFFEPYGYQFTLSNFLYLVDAPRLDIVTGATSGRVAGALADAQTLEDVLQIEEELGRVRFEPYQAEQLDAFLRRFVPVRSSRSTSIVKDLLQAPPLLWTSPFRAGVPPDVEFERVIITNVTSLYNEGRYREIRSVPIRVVELKAPPDARIP